MKKAFLILVIAVCVLAAGCRKNESGTASGSTSAVPTLTWWLVGGDSAELAECVRLMSDYTEKQIGVRLEIKISGWGDQQQRFTTIINSGEYFDIMFDDLADYSQRVAQGAFADITDLVKTASPKMWNLIPQDIWTGVKINNKIYAVPTWKDSAITQWVIWDHNYVTKYNIDITKTDLPSMDRYFRAIKAGEGSRFYPYRLSNGGTYQLFRNYDTLSAGLAPMGMNLNDPNHRVVFTLEQSDVREILNYMHRWYQDGIINPDAAVSVEDFKGQIFMTAQGWPGADAVWEAQQGVEQYDIHQFVGPNLSTDSIQGSLNSISSNSRYKTESLKLLELANTDPIFRDMLAYGIEGRHFNYVTRPSGTNPGVIKKINTNWPLSAYQHATFFTMSTTDDQPADQWQKVRENDASATPSPLLGFSLDRASILNELTNCRQVWDRYAKELVTGTSDPAVVIPQIKRDLEAVGFNRVLAEAQRQVDEFLRTK
ncbi:MAG: ABC transporter substrate-binding protein [Treponema sp.]|nr:ABC transporter substrate-binding protein [Treponema sp.]